MLLNIFSVYDAKVEAYMQPFFSRSTGEAVRSFQDISSDPNHMISKHPEDFFLYHLGTFDDQTSVIEYINPVSLGSALSIFPSN